MKHGLFRPQDSAANNREHPLRPASQDEQALSLVTPPTGDPSQSAASSQSGKESKDNGVDKESKLFNIFDTSGPSHMGTGLLSGAWNFTKGLGLGAAALVAAPYEGYRTNGVGGAAVGLGVGVVAAVVLPVVGAFTGAQQVGYGAVNTYQAITEGGHGKIYDKKSGTWLDKYHSLTAESAQVEEEYQAFLEQKKNAQANKEKSQDPLARRESQRLVADTTYYDILSVPTDASQAEIRKAYYKIALECHPDKQQEDPEAKEKFQKIGEAYQVLGDDARRAQYDSHGKSATEKMDFLDPGIFFAMLFGSERLEPYVGKLKLTTIVENDEDSPEMLLMESKDIGQLRRQVTLAVQLRDRLQPYVEALQTNNQKAICDWEVSQRRNAVSLCKESFGPPLVDTIGFVYENYADQFLGKKNFAIVGGVGSSLKHRTRQFQTFCDAARSAIKVSRTTKKAEKKRKQKKDIGAEDTTGKPPQTDAAEDSEPMTPEERIEMEVSLNHILDTMLYLCLVDLNSTIKMVARKTLNDKDVDESTQSQRARALQRLGSIFQEISFRHKQDTDNIRKDPNETMHEAYVKMAQKMNDNQTESPGPM